MTWSRKRMEKFKDFLKYAQPGMAIVNSLRFKEVPIMTLLDGEDEKEGEGYGNRNLFKHE